MQHVRFCIIVNDTDASRNEAASQRNTKRGIGSAQVLARVLNSDAHTLHAVGRNAASNRRITRYKMESPSFEGLRIALEEADTRVRIEDEVPNTVPRILGIKFEGGFLANQCIHFSPNLTCLVGGRGSGKSTTFTAVRLLSGVGDYENSVIDTDVWSDFITLHYVDQAGQEHILGRGTSSDVENINAPDDGPTSFSIESYGQGETQSLVQRAQDDPLTLANFLDRLISNEAMLQEEDNVRDELNQLMPKIKVAEQNVAKIDGCKRDLQHARSQIEKLKSERSEEIIELQQKLERDKRARQQIMAELAKLELAAAADGVLEITSAIKDLASMEDDSEESDENVDIDAIIGESKDDNIEAKTILSETEGFEASVTSVSNTLNKSATTFITTAKDQIKLWQARDAAINATIEAKKAELLKAGIRLDIPFINKVVADEVRLAKNLSALHTWVPDLKRLRNEYEATLLRRWEARKNVLATRLQFAKKATAALANNASDIHISLKYDSDCLSPEAYDLIVEAMAWRTNQQQRAGALITGLTLRELLNCIKSGKSGPIATLKSDTGQNIFSPSEVQAILERLSDPDVMFALESAAIYDLPKLTVTKRTVGDDGKDKHVARDFSKLSLGQQQSVILAIMLISDSTVPLIIDQPEDNLDGEFIYKTLIPAIRRAKERRQVIVVTHNANIAILSDAEQIVVLKANNEKGVITTRGSIDHLATRDQACLILEGAREAFDRRTQIYNGGLLSVRRDTGGAAQSEKAGAGKKLTVTGG